MKISKNGQYALLSVADLAMHTADGHESLAHIAERQHIEPRYLGQIFFALKNAGLVKSVRGKTGGYYLSRPPRSSAPERWCAPSRVTWPPRSAA